MPHRHLDASADLSDVQAYRVISALKVTLPGRRLPVWLDAGDILFYDMETKRYSTFDDPEVFLSLSSLQKNSVPFLTISRETFSVVANSRTHRMAS